MLSVCCGNGHLATAAADLSGADTRRKIEEIGKRGTGTVVNSRQQCVKAMKIKARRKGGTLIE